MLKKSDIGVGIYLLAAIIFFIIRIPYVLLYVMLAIILGIAGSTGYVFLPNPVTVYYNFQNIS